MNEEALKSEATHVEEQSTALEKVEKAEVSISSIETHRTGLALAEKHLPTERVREIAVELARIDEIEQTETVEMRRELGTLPKEFARTEYALVAQGINPSRLTVEEAANVLAYTTNSSEDAIEKKTNLIAGAINRIHNGVHSRRDWSFDPERQARFDRLADKYDRYERGEIDIECGFDRERYTESIDSLRGIDDDHSFDDAREIATAENAARMGDHSNGAYARFFRDMGVASRYERLFDEFTVEELLEENIISEDDLFLYGPFTRRDISEDFELFKTSTWVDIVNNREKGAVGDILEQVIPGRTDDVEMDLTREYVAREVLPNRRPGLKNTLALVASVGLEYLESGWNAAEEVLGTKQADDLQRSLAYASYYSARIMGMSSEELREEYGTSRPVKKEFYEELLKRSENMTEQEEKYLAIDEAPYATKLDSHLFIAETLFEPVMAANSEDDGTDFEGLALPGDILPGGLGAATQNLIETESFGE